MTAVKITSGLNISGLSTHQRDIIFVLLNDGDLWQTILLSNKQEFNRVRRRHKGDKKDWYVNPLNLRSLIRRCILEMQSSVSESTPDCERQEIVYKLTDQAKNNEVIKRFKYLYG